MKTKKEEKNQGQRKPMIVQVKEYLFEKYHIRYNEISDDLEAKSKEEKEKPFELLNENNLLYELKSLGYNIDNKNLNIITRSDLVERYNPIKSYFEGLPSWNPIGLNGENDYIGQLCSYVKARDQEEFNYHFRKHLIRCVACGLGVDFNKQCFTLASPVQNLGKSSFVRFLAPESLQNYYSETFRPESKDTAIAMTQNFIINIDELANLSKSDIDAVKKMVSTDTVKERRVYGRKDERMKRIASFFATTNKDEFLTDETGSVRWLCFEILHIDFAYKQKVDINKVWAQAYGLFLRGERYQLNREEIQKNEERNKKYQKTSVEDELVRKHFVEDEEKGKENFRTATEVLLFLQAQYGTKLNPVNIGKALVNIATKEQVRRSGSYPVKGYYVKQI